jgi:hypothetical protein
LVLLKIFEAEFAITEATRQLESLEKINKAIYPAVQRFQLFCNIYFFCKDIRMQRLGDRE